MWKVIPVLLHGLSKAQQNDKARKAQGENVNLGQQTT